MYPLDTPLSLFINTEDYFSQALSHASFWQPVSSQLPAQAPLQLPLQVLSLAQHSPAFFVHAESQTCTVVSAFASAAFLLPHDIIASENTNAAAKNTYVFISPINIKNKSIKEIAANIAKRVQYTKTENPP